MDDQKQSVADELSLQKEDHQFQLQLQEQQHKHENELKNKDIGLLGKVFGTSENGSRNIALTIMLLLIIFASIFTICIYSNQNPDKEFISEIWNLVIPIITLSLGYIFGKNNQ